MAFFEEFSKKAKNAAAVAADKAKDAAELTKITVAIAGEQKNIDKNFAFSLSFRGVRSNSTLILFLVSFCTLGLLSMFCAFMSTPP